MYLCTHWSRRLNSKLLTYRYRDLHDGGCLPAFSLIIHPKKAIFLYISILPFHEPSSPVWTPCLCIFSSSCLNHLVLKTAQGIIHSDKATLILPVTGCFPFFHSTTFSLSPQSDYKCLEGRDHVFPNPIQREIYVYSYFNAIHIVDLGSWPVSNSNTLQVSPQHWNSSCAFLHSCTYPLKARFKT